MAPSVALRGIQSTRRDELFSRVIDAALGLFAERGYSGTSIPDVMAKAGIGAGSLYRLFESKEALVNAVFRDAKRRLERALRDGLRDDLAPRERFDELWARLGAFARNEPVAFRFLELQDHAPYLDGESRQVELTVLAPIVAACLDLQRRGVFRDGVGADVIMAFVWGAFVGLLKAERLGYVKLAPTALDVAGDACWRAFATGHTATQGRKQKWKRPRPR